MDIYDRKMHYMLSFFKRKNKNLFQNWQIPIDANYRLIDNGDAIQFVNTDQSLVFYFSLLTTTNNSLLSEEVLAKMQPSITRVENGWQFKGTRPGGKEILVCVCSYTNENDEALVKDLFSNIVYIGK